MNSEAVTYIGFCCDHSGSMKMNGKDKLALSNFNEQRAKLLKEDDETMDNLVTIVEFDDVIHCNIDNMPISEVKELDRWWVGGMTALNDSIAYCINNIKEKMSNDKRDNKAALIIIQTDGGENQSSDYKGEQGRIKINKMINELEETKKWSFVFLGDGIDKSIAVDLGFKMSNIMCHDGNNNARKHSYNVTMDGLGKYFSSRKAGETQTMNFYDEGDSEDEK